MALDFTVFCIGDLTSLTMAGMTENNLGDLLDSLYSAQRVGQKHEEEDIDRGHSSLSFMP